MLLLMTKVYKVNLSMIGTEVIIWIPVRFVAMDNLLIMEYKIVPFNNNFRLTSNMYVAQDFVNKA